MTPVELKSNFHSLIDEFENINLLQKFYGILSIARNYRESSLWTSLNADEQNELKEIELESRNDENLIIHNKLYNKHSKWL